MRKAFCLTFIGILIYLYIRFESNYLIFSDIVLVDKKDSHKSDSTIYTELPNLKSQTQMRATILRSEYDLRKYCAQSFENFPLHTGPAGWVALATKIHLENITKPLLVNVAIKKRLVAKNVWLIISRKILAKKVKT